jgi:hypothetical protein
MSLRDDEQRILDAIENQLRTDEPQLMHCFSAFCRVTPPIKPVKGWQCAPHGRKAQRGRRRRTDRQAYAIMIEFALVVIAVVLVVLLMLGAVWMLAVLSH